MSQNRIGSGSMDATHEGNASSMESLIVVNKMAIDLANAETEKDVWNAICRRLMEIPGVFSSSASLYHPSIRQMETINVNFPPDRTGIINKAEKIIGESILGMHMPVDDETYQMLLKTPVATGRDLNEVTFGKIPKIAALTINKLFGLGGFYGLAFVEGGELLGTSMIVMNKGFVPLSSVVRDTIARIGAVAIRRARNNEALRNSEEKFRSLVNSLHDRVIVLNRELRQVEVYGRSSKQRDNDKERFLGKTAEETVGKEAARPHTEAGQRALAGESVLYEWSWEEPGEGISWYRTRLNPIMGSDGAINKIVSVSHDITDLKKAVELASESEERFRSVIEAAPEAIFVHSGGKFLYLNPSAVSLFGVQRKEDLIGKDLMERIAPEYRERIRERIEKYREHGKPAPLMEQEILHIDGTPIPVETIAMRIWYGGKDAYVGFLRDLREERKSEEALKRSGEWLEMTQHAGNIGSWDWDIPAGKLYWSETFYDLFGLKKEEKPSFDIWRARLHEGDRAKAEDKIKAAIEQHQPLENEYRIVRAGGEIVWILASGTTKYGSDGKPVRMSGTCIDITGIKKVEEGIRENAARLELALQSSKMGIWYWDIEKDHRYFDEAVSLMLGLDRHNFKGTAEEFYSVVHPDDRERLRLEMAKTLEDDVAYEPEYRVIWPDGSTHHISARARLTRDGNGKPSRVNGVAWDVTDRRIAEMEHKQLQAALFQAQKMESIGTLAGGIAHDFNNLLMGISGNVELMEMDIEKGAGPRARIGKVISLVDRGSELTRALLGFARKGKYDAKPINLGILVADTCAMFGRMRKDIALKVDLGQGTSPVMADFTQIEQVLLNLLVNAGQAMPMGGEMSVSLCNVKLSEIQAASYAVSPGGYVRMEVIDSGVGMDKETISRIFEPFFTTKERGKGTGLGLASAYGIVKNHGGYIGVESAPGRGSKFFVLLPATDLSVEDSSTNFDGVRIGRETILLVDDEEMILDVSGSMLQAMGYTVITAGSGKETLELVKQNPEIGLVILDMIMPGMNGRETFKAIREINPSLKVLLASGYSIDGQAEELIAEGCNGFIQKPFTSSSLSGKIGEILQ